MNAMVDDLVGPDEDDSMQRRPSSSGLYRFAAQAERQSPSAQPMQRMSSVSALWNDNPAAAHTGLRDATNGALRTPPPRARAGHARIGSATSIRSQAPPYSGTMHSSFVPTPPTAYPGAPKSLAAGDGYASGMQSPLLFGAGGGPWSTMPSKTGFGRTPPNGQGG